MFRRRALELTNMFDPDCCPPVFRNRNPTLSPPQGVRAQGFKRWVLGPKYCHLNGMTALYHPQVQRFLFQPQPTHWWWPIQQLLKLCSNPVFFHPNAHYYGRKPTNQFPHNPDASKRSQTPAFRSTRAQAQKPADVSRIGSQTHLIPRRDAPHGGVLML